MPIYELLPTVLGIRSAPWSRPQLTRNAFGDSLIGVGAVHDRLGDIAKFAVAVLGQPGEPLEERAMFQHEADVVMCRAGWSVGNQVEPGIQLAKQVNVRAKNASRYMVTNVTYQIRQIGDHPMKLTDVLPPGQQAFKDSHWPRRSESATTIASCTRAPSSSSL